MTDENPMMDMLNDQINEAACHPQHVQYHPNEGGFWHVVFSIIFWVSLSLGVGYAGCFAYDYYWDYQAEQAKVLADKIYVQIRTAERDKEHREWVANTRSQQEDYPGIDWESRSSSGIYMVGNGSGAGIMITGGATSGAGLILKSD